MRAEQSSVIAADYVEELGREAVAAAEIERARLRLRLLSLQGEPSGIHWQPMSFVDYASGRRWVDCPAADAQFYRLTLVWDDDA